MTNFPADTYWSVDGTSLQTYAFNIETLGGGRLALPPPRGENLGIPFLQGRRYVPKFPDSRTLTLGMWVQGCDEAGNPPTTVSLRQRYEINYRKLRALLWHYERQMALVKRFLITNGEVVNATAMAEFAGGLEVEKEGGPYRGKFTVDLLLADPFFYGDAIQLSPDGWNVDTTVTILGDAPSMQATLECTGPVVNPVFTLVADWVKFNGTVAAGATLTLDLATMNAHYRNAFGSVTNVNNLMIKSNPRHWLACAPLDHNFRGDCDSVSFPSIFKIIYQPAYL